MIRKLISTLSLFIYYKLYLHFIMISNKNSYTLNHMVSLCDSFTYVHLKHSSPRDQVLYHMITT